ncbi:hypothetical protein RW1_011_01770 [Rhodococcus wratislaviensis NBRC 100605]|uniref:Uncharacterized protein n=1 Tax=Rhodococcus wratislaviensis NBRC 100605 TaxID=1219028 RepID=X0PND9_RHOWR|nr:hypothetical protein RW1_011_01770 [Rhodococcus wratislaviensis NBRC 100605]
MGPGEVLAHSTREECSYCESDRVGTAVDPGAMAWGGFEVDKRRTQCADCGAGREALHNPRNEK